MFGIFRGWGRKIGILIVIVILLGTAFGFNAAGHGVGSLAHNIMQFFHSAQQGAQGH
jgi:hypothetical protein